MKKILFFLCLSCFTFLLKGQNLYFPPNTTVAWDTLAPAGLNYCSDRIDSLNSYLEAGQTKAFILLKDGKIVLEEYYDGYRRDSSRIWYSAGKSLMSVLVGIAQEEGLLSIQDKSSDYLGKGWTSLLPAQEDSIKIWNQLTMTSGLDETEFTCTDSVCLTYVSGSGTRWAYHNSPYSLLRDVLENASGENLNLFTNRRIENKIGMRGIWLPVGDNNFYFSSARDMARFGLLVQANGYWGGTAVLSDTAYLRQMRTSSQSLNPSYGYLWWLNGKTSYITSGNPTNIVGSISPDAPADVYVAAGAFGQFISISPSLGLIMIRQGLSDDGDLTALDMHNEIWKRIMALDCGATSRRSEFLQGIEIFPNPASEYVEIQGQFPREELSVKLFDLSGQKVLEDTGVNSLRVSKLRPGMYMAFLSIKGKTTVRKILKLP